MTSAEAALWKILQRSKLDGRKFRRQHSVGNYILDFYCPAERLAIELDGEGHLEYHQILYDVERKIFLDQYGIKVIRFANFLIFDETEYVLNRIRSYFGWWEESTTPSAKRRHPS